MPFDEPLERDWNRRPWQVVAVLTAVPVLSSATLYVLLGVLIGDGVRVRDHGVACGRYNHSNVTFVPFESLDPEEGRCCDPPSRTGRSRSTPRRRTG